MLKAEVRRWISLASLPLLAAVVIALLALATPVQAGKEDKVTICHYPPGNPDNVQIISVGAAAVEAHVTLHGDDLYINGICGGGGD